MEQNVGGLDRTGRTVIGAVLVLAGAAGYTGVLRVAVGPLPQALTAVLLVLVGSVLLLTAYTRSCPINAAAGIDTSDR